MGVLSNYYRHARLTSSGQVRRQEIPEAKTFLMQQFPELAAAANLPDLVIQKALMQLITPYAPGPQSFLGRFAEICLRCYISNGIEATCLDLVRKFELQKKISQSEILSYVLDDIDPLQPFNSRSPYRPLALKILSTFDSSQSSLSYWTRRLVIQHPELNRLMNEHRIYIMSDWAILNQTSQAQFKRRLSASMTATELQRGGVLLESFHLVYRADRLRQSASVLGKRCLDPNDAQIQRMICCLQAKGLTVSAAHLLTELRTLAWHLRHAKSPLALSLDGATPLLPVADSSTSGEENFLAEYNQASEECLFQAVQKALQRRFDQLKTCRQKQTAFLKALFLFFIKGKSMGEIAPLIGLEKQFQVTRLLKLKQIRSMICQQYVLLMQPRLQSILSDHLLPEQFAHLELEPLLTELSEQILDEDTKECYSTQRMSRSMLSLCICRFLRAYHLH